LTPFQCDCHCHPAKPGNVLTILSCDSWHIQQVDSLICFAFTLVTASTSSIMSLSSPSQRDNDASRHDRQPNRRLQDPHQRQQQQTLEFDWISNTALDSSNDRSPNDPEITIENGYPAVYSCQDDIVVEGEDTRTLQFQFDYEFTMKDPRESSLVEVFYQDLPVLEWGILLMVVQAVDLGPCNLQQQQRAIRKFATDTESDTDATTDTTSGRQSAFDTRVVSLASTRKDVVDPTVGK